MSQIRLSPETNFFMHIKSVEHIFDDTSRSCIVSMKKRTNEACLEVCKKYIYLHFSIIQLEVDEWRNSCVVKRAGSGGQGLTAVTQPWIYSAYLSKSEASEFTLQSQSSELNQYFRPSCHRKGEENDKDTWWCVREGEPENRNIERVLLSLCLNDTKQNHSAPGPKVQREWLKPQCLLAGCHPARQFFFLKAAARPCQSSSIVQRLYKQLLNSFIALSHSFRVPFSMLLLLSHSHIVPSKTSCCDICCCLRRTPPGSEPRRHSVLVATSLVLRTPLDYSGTSVYKPIGVLVCEPPKGQVATMNNVAPFYLWLLYLLHCEWDKQYDLWDYTCDVDKGRYMDGWIFGYWFCSKVISTIIQHIAKKTQPKSAKANHITLNMTQGMVKKWCIKVLNKTK